MRHKQDAIKVKTRALRNKVALKGKVQKLNNRDGQQWGQ